MLEIEFEKTYLVSKLPNGLVDFPHKEIIDLYVPAKVAHPDLRIRKKGNVFEITKKHPVLGTDSSEQEEHTIKLTEDEFVSLSRADGRRISKIRYDYTYNNVKAEIDIFTGDLEGLVLVDFEFADSKSKFDFQAPDFCLADVTQDKTFAGGMLCGKKYSDIEWHLKELGYTRIKY